MLYQDIPTITPTDKHRSIADFVKADRKTPDTIKNNPTPSVQRCDRSRHNGPTNRPDF